MRRRRDDADADAADGVLLEFQQIGNAVKVSAIDPATGVEVSITGPASAGEAVLSQAAVRKLRYVLSRRGGGTPPDESGGGPGIIA